MIPGHFLKWCCCHQQAYFLEVCLKHYKHLLPRRVPARSRPTPPSRRPTDGVGGWTNSPATGAGWWVDRPSADGRTSPVEAGGRPNGGQRRCAAAERGLSVCSIEQRRSRRRDDVPIWQLGFDFGRLVATKSWNPNQTLSFETAFGGSASVHSPFTTDHEKPTEVRVFRKSDDFSHSTRVIPSSPTSATCRSRVSAATSDGLAPPSSAHRHGESKVAFSRYASNPFVDPDSSRC